METTLGYEAELKNLFDAREILSNAYMNTIGAWVPHSKIWRSIEYIDSQISPIHREMLADPELERA